MSCGCCGKNKDAGQRCCVCNLTCKEKDYSPWGTKRRICWRCHNQQIILIEKRERLNEKVRKLMAGVDV